MIFRLLASTILVAGLTQAALAQNGSNANQSTSTPSTQSSPNGSPSQNQNGSQAQEQNISQEVRAQLTKDGYTDVKVVPGSLVVNAKNKQGQNVMMWLTPHSATVLTEAQTNSAKTTGSGANSSQPNNQGSQAH